MASESSIGPDLSEEELKSAEQAIPSFARKLDEFADQLSERERIVLATLMYRAMGPLDRVRLAGGGDAVTEDEMAQLLALSSLDEP